MINDETVARAAARRLAHLNDARYLAHKQDQIAAIRDFAARLPAPCSLIEVGSNRGRFAMGLARAHPERHVLAIEWRKKWVIRVRQKSFEEGLSNLHCLRADARIALPMLASTETIEQLFVLYPDPWWKKRHEGRRLFDDAFFEVAAELLAPSGELLIKTDVRLTYERAMDVVSRVAALEVMNPLEWPDERAWAFSTREAQCLETGIATYRLYLRKRSERLTPEPPRSP